MTRNLSVFLDLLRLFAALLVLVGHAGEVYRMDLPSTIGHSAKEGVAIFFVLSGFVIAFVTDSKERDWWTFLRARALRMYSVVPVAILVLCLCYAVGVSVAPEVYGLGAGSANVGAAGQPPALIPMLRYLTFTNELWFARITISTGGPFWSLGFEVAYYVAFAIFFYARGNLRWVLGLLWLLAVGPRIAVAFPLWLIGAGTWSVVRRDIRIGGRMGAGLLAAILLAGLAWRRWAAFMAAPLFEWPAPTALAGSMCYYLVLCILLASAIVVFAACTPRGDIWPDRIVRVVRYCAGASFTLYIAHLPVMVLVAALWPASSASLAGGLAAIAMTMAAMLMLAELGERRKNAYARFLPTRSMTF